MLTSPAANPLVLARCRYVSITPWLVYVALCLSPLKRRPQLTSAELL